MATKYYSTKVQALGPMVKDFINEKMMIIFNENAPAELRDFCVLHRGNQLDDTVKVGDTLHLGDHAYKVVFVGSQVQKNLKDLGHITIRFNGNSEGESLEGSLYVEDKPAVIPQPGEEIYLTRD